MTTFKHSTTPLTDLCSIAGYSPSVSALDSKSWFFKFLQLSYLPDDDGVNVLMPGLHPWQAPHFNHVGVQVQFLPQGGVQAHQLSSPINLSTGN